MEAEQAMFSRSFVVLLLTLVLSPAWADILIGRVVSVADGDTITVLDDSKTQHKIRLAGIDAPERKQPFGQRSKELLSDLVFGKTVQVETEKADRYGRQVGKVLIDGRDANLAIIAAGLAWHYKKYQKEQAASDRLLYASAERMRERGVLAFGESGSSSAMGLETRGKIGEASGNTTSRTGSPRVFGIRTAGAVG